MGDLLADSAQETPRRAAAGAERCTELPELGGAVD